MFTGRSLSMIHSTFMSLNPDTEDAKHLRLWYDTEGRKEIFREQVKDVASLGLENILNINNLRTIKDIKEAHVEQGSPPATFCTRATIIYIRPDNPTYPACPREGCNRKVIESSGKWICEWCDRSFSAPEHRYTPELYPPHVFWNHLTPYHSRFIISVIVADHTDRMRMSGFNDIGTQVLGMTADEIMNLKVLLPTILPRGMFCLISFYPGNRWSSVWRGLIESHV